MYKFLLGACDTELNIVAMAIDAQTSPPLSDFSWRDEVMSI